MFHFQASSHGGKSPLPSNVGGSHASFTETYPNFPEWQYEIMNLDGSYNFVNLDRLEYTLNVPWNNPVYFQAILLFYLMIFVLLAVSEFRSYIPDWCRPYGREHEDDWRLVAGCTYPILSICVH